jgi:hypothetical protein
LNKKAAGIFLALSANSVPMGRGGSDFLTWIQSPVDTYTLGENQAEECFEFAYESIKKKNSSLVA